MLEPLLILAVGLVGGCLPLFWSWSERALHLALALSAGIFLGAIFLHLVPSVAGFEVADPVAALFGPGHGAGHGSPSETGHVAQHGNMTLWLFVVLGVLMLYLAEGLVLRTHDHDDLHRHRAVGAGALLGLSVHSLTAGMGYGIAHAQGDPAHALLIAIVGHKGFEAFSLTSCFQLAGARRGTIAGIAALFALVTPAGYWLGHGMTRDSSPMGLAILTALATGTFLYVCLTELLPEVFHHREDGIAKISLLTLGLALITAMHALGT